MSFVRRFGAVLGVATLVTAQFNSTSTSGSGAYDADAILCNTTFARANATGIFKFDPGVPQGRTQVNDTGYAPEAAWAVAIAENSNNQTNNFGLQLSLLYSTGGANYSDDVHLGYDVCAIALNPIAFLNNTILRAQSDNGSCLQTLDSNCVTAITDAANLYTGWIDSASPRPNSNLTSTSLPTVCDQIAKLMASNFPPACKPFYNDTSLEWIDSNAALTEYNRNGLSELSKTCLVNGTGPKAFHAVANFQLPDVSAETYDSLARYPVPIINIFMPTANADVTSSNDGVNSVMVCTHIDSFNSGSRVTPSYGEPTPVDYGNSRKSLSGGAIAGIVIGSVVGVLLILLAILLLINFRGWRSKMMGRSPAGVKEIDDTTQPEVIQSEKAKEAEANFESGGSNINELSPHSFQSAELPSVQPRAELSGAEHVHELDNAQKPVEMLGDVPNTKHV